MENMLQDLIKFENDSKWFSNEYDKIKENYRGKYILIKDSKVIVAEETLEKIKEDAEKLGIDLEKTVVEYIPFKDVVMII